MTRRRLSVPLGAAALALLAATPASAVLRGTSTPVDRFPAVAQIERNDRSVCTGTLVAPRVVLTAAHCVAELMDPDERSARPTHVTFGRQTSAPGGGQRVAVKRVAFDPQWDLAVAERDAAFELLASDVALIELVARPAEVAPLPLIAPEERELLAANRPSIVIGWGIHERGQFGRRTPVRGLHSGSAPIRSDRYCTSFARRLASGVDLFGVPVRIGSNPLCVGAVAAPGPTTCKGDSGGPLLVDRAGVPVIAGVTSFGTPRCTGNVGGYARLLDSRARRWIDRHLVGDRLVVHPDRRKPRSASARRAARRTLAPLVDGGVAR